MTAPVRILLSGALGRMGECVRAAIAAEPRAELAAAFDVPNHPGREAARAAGVPLVEKLSEAVEGADVAIDFSVPDASLGLLRAAAERGLPCSVGTTGFDAAQRAEIDALAAKLPLVLAPNFSRSVAVLAHLAERAAGLLGDEFDAEIVELHHAAKRDAPSGTALRLAEVIARARHLDVAAATIAGRRGDTGPRPDGAIGIQALRGGDNPGEHSVLFVGRGERLELLHRATTRDHFAAGALQAALWLVGRPPGLHPLSLALGLDAS